MSVIWITGLSGSGKTTLAKKIFQQLKESCFSPILIDGDEIRKVLKTDKEKYNVDDRIKNAWRINYKIMEEKVSKTKNLMVPVSDYEIDGKGFAKLVRDKNNNYKVVDKNKNTSYVKRDKKIYKWNSELAFIQME